MLADGGLDLLDLAGTIILPGWRMGPDAAPPPPSLLEALRIAHRRGARLMSLCSGVFVLAAAGLLDGRRATTHWWRHAETLALRHPEVRLVPDVLYVDDGELLTSAGGAAALDLCLHVVRRDFGPRHANAVARRLVVPPQREGGQAQYIDRPLPARGGSRLAGLLDLMRARIDEDWTIERLADAAAVSPRGLHRRFRAATGLAPGAWLLAERIARAKDLLESTDQSVEAIAQSVGFASAATLRLHFREKLGVTPSGWRLRAAVSDR
jgi:AraC family transcriptional activator FtrA